MNQIIDHFTDQQQTQIFQGFDRYGKGIVESIGPSPLSFAHDDTASHEGPMQEGCASCFLIHAARKLPSLKKTAAKKLIRQMRQALATFGDENQKASDEILEILAQVERSL